MISLPYLDHPENAKKVKVDPEENNGKTEDPVNSNQVDNDNLCMICQVPYTGPSDRFNLAMHAESSCIKHDFCKRCLFRILEEEKKPGGQKFRCPICRALPDPNDTLERARRLRTYEVLKAIGVTYKSTQGREAWVFSVEISDPQLTLLGADDWLTDVGLLLNDQGVKNSNRNLAQSFYGYGQVLSSIEKDVCELVSVRNDLKRGQGLFVVKPLCGADATITHIHGITRASITVHAADLASHVPCLKKIVDIAVVDLLGKLSDIKALTNRHQIIRDKFDAHSKFAACPELFLPVDRVCQVLHEWLSERHPPLRALNYEHIWDGALGALYQMTRLRELSNIVLEAPAPLPDDLREKLGL